MKNKAPLFFDNHTNYEFSWKSLAHLRVGPVVPASKDQISNSLKDLSSESIRNRFMGSKKEFSESELEYFTNLDGKNHYAIGIEEDLPTHRGIAIARLVRSSEVPEEAEVAITVIDEYQGKGLGTFLIQLITLAASERGIAKLTFTTLPQNKGIHHLIQKIGTPEAGAMSKDSALYFLEMKNIDLKTIRTELVKTLPTIGTFDLGT